MNALKLSSSALAFALCLPTFPTYAAKLDIDTLVPTSTFVSSKTRAEVRADAKVVLEIQTLVAPSATHGGKTRAEVRQELALSKSQAPMAYYPNTINF